MVYVNRIEDSRALIYAGPVTYGQMDPKVFTSANLADVADSWELDLLPDKEVEWPALRRNAIDALERIEARTDASAAERRLLDFGSGWGFFLAVAKERGWIPYGVEPLPASAVYARATFGLNVVTDTLHEHTLPRDFFDVVTSFQVFEHLPTPAEDLRHLRRALRSDGILLIEVPNFETWSMKALRSRHRHFVQDHLNFFSLDTLGRMLVKSGFEVIDRFHPTRRMSVRHLMTSYVRRYSPRVVGDTLERSLRRTALWQRTIGINIGDIITVIARKLS